MISLDNKRLTKQVVGECFDSVEDAIALLLEGIPDLSRSRKLLGFEAYRVVDLFTRGVFDCLDQDSADSVIGGVCPQYPWHTVVWKVLSSGLGQCFLDSNKLSFVVVLPGSLVLTKATLRHVIQLRH